jgi:hypothetical protein
VNSGNPREEAVMPWDPFAVLWLPHEPVLQPWRLLRAYVRRMNIMHLTVPDPELWPGEADRISHAAWALRTQRRRREILADLEAQRGLLDFLLEPEVRAALADTVLTPLRGQGGLEEACDRRALEREAALMRLERRAAGRRPWPPPIDPTKSRPSRRKRDRR